MEYLEIEYNGKTYEVKEPSIELWNKLTLLKEIHDDDQFPLLILSLSTGLDLDEIRKAGWYEITNAASHISDYFLNQSTKFYNEFEFDGNKYKFIDLNNLTFGEFIDIDEYLKRPETQRKTQINWLMALLYREVDENGNLVEYDASKIEDRAALFRALPIKYMNGAMRFFLTLEDILLGNTPSFFQRVKDKTRAILSRFLVFGVGIVPLYLWQVRTC